MDKSFDAVVFDYGGVMITSITNKFVPLAERAETSVEVIREIVMGPLGVSTDHPWHRAERGEIPLDQIQEGLKPYAAEYSVKLFGDEIETVYSNTKSGLTAPYTIIEPMIQKAIEVQQKGFSIALLTNLFTEFYPTVKKELTEVKFNAWVASSSSVTVWRSNLFTEPSASNTSSAKPSSNRLTDKLLPVYIIIISFGVGRDSSVAI